MKKVILLVSTLFIGYTPIDEGQMTKKERKFAVNFLESSMKDLFKTVKKVSQEQWNFKPADGGWSIGGIAEHLLIAEQGFVNLVPNKIMKNPDFKVDISEDDRLTDKHVIDFISDRSPDNRVKTTPAAEPKGNLTSPKEFIENYEMTRKKYIDYVSKTNDELKTYYFDSPAGKISAYQWILLASAHVQRHHKQMKEVMESAAFPK